MATYGANIFLILFGVGFIAIIIWVLLKLVYPDIEITDRILGTISVILFVPFSFEFFSHTTPHFKDIDPMIEACYAPLSHSHLLTFITFLCLSLISLIVLSKRKLALPPLVITLCLALASIGVIIITFFTIQVSSHDSSRLFASYEHKVALSLVAFPVCLILIHLRIIYNTIKHQADLNKDIHFKSKFLNHLNSYLSRANSWPQISILLIIPLFIIVTIILVLFGQEPDSITKVFTDTATWKYSTEIHPPPVDDRHGHYLCTVAARGNPTLVKPITIGLRNGEPIIVNRQLQIANAFEQLIEELCPLTHKIVRRNYDEYGLNLSKRIDTEYLSNLTYLLMKPIEWMFLISLYLCYVDPEKQISIQYKGRQKIKTTAI